MKVLLINGREIGKADQDAEGLLFQFLIGINKKFYRSFFMPPYF